MAFYGRRRPPTDVVICRSCAIWSRRATLDLPTGASETPRIGKEQREALSVSANVPVRRQDEARHDADHDPMIAHSAFESYPVLARRFRGSVLPGKDHRRPVLRG